VLLAGPVALLVAAALTWFGTPTARVPGPTAEAVVDGPGAQLLRVAVSARDPQVRASVWRRCAGPGCTHPWLVVAVTGDGFVHRTLAGPWPADDVRVTATAHARFLLHVDGVPGFLLDADGNRRTPGLPGRAAPLRGGELLLGTLAVDPDTGRTHRLPLLSGTHGLVATEDSRLTGVTADALVTSVDGGTTWRRTPLPADGAVTVPLTSARPDIVAALRGDQGVTWLPVTQALRSVGGRTTLVRVPQQPGARPFVDAGLVLPDGSLLVDVVAWSSDRNGDHVGSVGPFVTDQGRWRSWHPLVPPRTPELRALRRHPLRLVGSAVRSGEAVALLASGTRAVAVDTAHRLWVPIRVR